MKKVVLSILLASFMMACDSAPEEQEKNNMHEEENATEVDSSIINIKKGTVELETAIDSLDDNIDALLNDLGE